MDPPDAPADERGAALTKSLRDRLEEQPWEELIPRLVLYASRLMKQRWWYGILDGGEGSGPGGKDAKDVVSEAIHDVFVGAGVAEGAINADDVDHIRRWDPRKDPEILPYLMSVVDSKISKLVESLENRAFRRLALQPSSANNEGFDPKLINTDVASRDSTPEMQLIVTQVERMADTFVWSFHRDLEGSELLQQIVECIIVGTVKPGEIAESLGVPPSEIYNAKKRLQRRLGDFLERERKGSTGGKGGETDGRR